MCAGLIVLHLLTGPPLWLTECPREALILKAGSFRRRALLCQASCCFFFLLLLLPCMVGADDSLADLQKVFPSTVSLGSYLPPLDSTDNVALASPNGMFNLHIEAWRDLPAFYCMAGVTNVKINPGSMLWGANNAKPLMVSSTCRLFLSLQGDLLLQHDGNNTAWQTHTAGMGISDLTLHDSGNLILHTADGVIVWQSFTQSPAFAWNSGMNLTSDITIFSSAPVVDGIASFNVAGSFGLQLHNHSTLVLFTNSDDPAARFVYWRSSFTNPSLSHHAHSEQVSYVAIAGNGFTFYDNSSQALGSIAPTLPPPANTSSALKCAVVDPSSANLQAYYRASHTWVMFYNSSISVCENPTQCGNFSLCNASTGACTCPPGFSWNSDGAACEQKTDISFPALSCSSRTTAEAISYRFVSVNVSFPPQFSEISSNSVENCTSLCLDSCVCKAALFDPDRGSCSLFSHLQTLPTKADSTQLLLLKIAGGRQSSKTHLAPIIGAISAAIAGSLCLICTASAICCIKKKRRRNARSTGGPSEDAFLQALPRLPPRYTYEELEKATNQFSTKLGSGGFGAVFEGLLPSGVKVAVKKLEGSMQSSAQFRAEVASIWSISHVNLVTLKGFCPEREWRLLVYELMERGSLDSWLFKGGDEKGKQLGWQRRCKIGLDTARGLAYLHHECGEKIVHCDVKPENILFDEEFNAKVGDFGLVKLVGQGQQSFILTTVKGSRGYLAPEWLQGSTITAKSDVYSFGIVLLELISGRRCLDSDHHGYLPTIAFRMVSTSSSSSAYFNKLKQHPALSDSVVTESKESLFYESLTSHKEDPILSYYKSSVLDCRPSPPMSLSNPSCRRADYGIDSLSMAALLDPRLSTDVDVSATTLERMIFIALWCVQLKPAARPSMSTVVQMMEGMADVPPPPLQSPLPEHINIFL